MWVLAPPKICTPTKPSVETGENTVILSEARLQSHTVELSVDVDVDVDDMDDVVDRQCRIGPMAIQITTRLGTVTLQVVTSSSSKFQSVVWLHLFQCGRKHFDDQSYKMSYLILSTFSFYCSYLLKQLKLSEDCMQCTPSLVYTVSQATPYKLITASLRERVWLFENSLRHFQKACERHS